MSYPNRKWNNFFYFQTPIKNVFYKMFLTFTSRFGSRFRLTFTFNSIFNFENLQATYTRLRFTFDSRLKFQNLQAAFIISVTNSASHSIPDSKSFFFRFISRFKSRFKSRFRTRFKFRLRSRSSFKFRFNFSF